MENAGTSGSGSGNHIAGHGNLARPQALLVIVSDPEGDEPTCIGEAVRGRTIISGSH